MNSRKIKSIVLVLATLGLFTGCVEENFDEPTTAIKTYNLTANKTVQNIYTASSSTVTQYTADDIIEAYVTSSDETGNFYNVISFQTIPTDASAPVAFSVSIDLKSYGKGFTPGRKAYIKLKGLYTVIADGSLKIGDIYQGGLGRIPNYKWENHLFPSETIVPEDSFVRTMTLAQAATNANINTLIELDNVQFADQSLARSYFDVDNGGGATNHNIVDATLGNTQRYFRVSSFATFAVKQVARGRGKIRGVMSKFGSDFQFLARYIDDIKLDTPRAYNFSGAYTENFESFAVNQKSFPNYVNFDLKGTKNWIIKSGKFLEMSSFGGTVEDNESYFFMPVNMGTASTFTFQIKAQFYNGACLKVYRTENYVPGMNIKDVQLYDITTSFTIPTATTSSFASAGVYNIPANVTGNGYFVFQYVGTSKVYSEGPVVTTTMQIDNVVVN
ncbi:DUF5689 domain-containing protein [Flavobacterium sp.]|uniref:DUF5689 domain-containing protein n=1 Tax=Flavobacterium sp. TaxID=239 RepID=UPI003D6A0464